jgi:hypothetical protein
VVKHFKIAENLVNMIIKTVRMSISILKELKESGMNLSDSRNQTEHSTGTNTAHCCLIGEFLHVAQNYWFKQDADYHNENQKPSSKSYPATYLGRCV